MDIEYMVAIRGGEDRRPYTHSMRTQRNTGRPSS